MPQAVRARSPTHRRRSSDPGRSSARTLATDLFEEIRSDILHNRLDPGARLMFRDLRERYRSGLSPLREALMRLATEGLVILEDHRGFRVAPATRDEMIDVANSRLLLQPLAPEAGGNTFHSGGRQFANKNDPDWKTLSGDPQYKDNVSAISDLILRPTAYSQL